MGVILQVALPSRVLAAAIGSSAVPPVQVRAAGLAYVRSTRAWQLAENQRAPWKSAIFSRVVLGPVANSQCAPSRSPLSPSVAVPLSAAVWSMPLCRVLWFVSQ